MRSKQTIAVFPSRRWTVPTAHSKLPAARAWRVVAVPASKYAADAPGVVAGFVPAAPAACSDGAYPVWVRLTDPIGRTPDAAAILVEHDGWYLEETGPDWHIEVVGAGVSDAQRFAFAVETVGDVAEAGQVNRPERAGVHLLWDSGVVAGGAIIQSPVLDFYGLESVDIIADNTGGIVARDLSVDMFLPDGVTPISPTLLLGKIMPAMRGHVLGGLIQPAVPSFWQVLYDVVSGLNAPLDTLALATDGMESLFALAIASAGTTVLASNAVLDDGTNGPSMATLAAALSQACSWAPGAAVGTGAAASQMAIGFAVPRRTRFTTTAAGAGNTVRLIVGGRGLLSGELRWQIQIGMRGRFTLAAGGALPARVIVFGG